ncbi:OmcA/MtrC family decaheme c-type cytochrome [Rhodoferax ferrireducens]|uniref:OmcA/MtrC family decaheme c-type cytochrome n=1 Tax=Rhodoferax ferrireducens TaxID=192843 RepID=UPI00298E3A2B|nr:OmcA/MtrC family decaheme c-type cytochrome [Rhodoferax ferrireducens]WPC66818.1 OmcA/MtrC family decaheme c-type cytochrome [Rhodoferax ferrireducens]
MDLTALVNVGSNTTAATPAAAAAWQSLAPQVTVTSVTINSAPVVKFTVKDAAGKAIVGLANYSQSSTATVKGLTNLGFTLAKLVPGTNGDPSKWVSYNVIRPVTVAEQGGTIAATASCNKTATAAATWCGTYPTTDTQGTLVDNGDGSYQYTFFRDVTKVKDLVSGLTDTADGLSKKADLGDLSYDPTLTHRLGIQLGGAAPGTGSNNPTANSTGAPASVNMVNTANAVYNFRPDGAAVTASRDIVKIDSCSSCHQGQVLAHGSRKDPNYCVTCHTDQIRYSFSMEAPASGFTLTGGITGTTQQKRAEQAVVNGRAVGNLPNFLHKLHMGNGLVKQGYNYNANGGAMLFNEVTFPQNVNNCTTCHDGSATAAIKTANGDNWKSVPSLLACGACHDGINFATGTGATLADKAKDLAAKVAIGTTQTGHVGGAKANNAQCVLCHDAVTIPTYHAAENASPHNPTVPVGLKNFKYEIKSAAATATSVTVVFKITADGTPVTFLAPAAGMANPLTGFTGAPGFLLAYAKTQDGVTTPIDYNNLGNGQSNAQPVSVSIASLLDTAKATTVGTLAGPDTSGYYTATIVGTANVFPTGAVLRTVALQGYFTQVAPAAARHTLSVVKMVGTDAARRSVVEPNKCGNCHEVFEGHGGNRNIGLGSEGIVVCLVCHNPGLVTSGRGIPDVTLANWKFTTAEDAILTAWGVVKTAVNGALGFPQVSNNFKDMIHGIHAGKDRTNPIAIARNRGASVNLIAGTQSGAITLIDGNEIGFPGILNNCESCHKAGTYSTVPANTLVSSFEANIAAANTTTTDAVNALKQPNVYDKVTTPFTAACVSCHDAATAQAHMTLNGGQILVLRTAANTAGESCAVCHSAGKEFDAAVVHK